MPHVTSRFLVRKPPHSPQKNQQLAIHGHLVYLGGVVLFYVPEDADVIVLHKIDGHTFAAVSPRSPDSLE